MKRESTLWSGRFAKGQDPTFFQFQRSLPCDQRLWREDLAGSRAWAKALHKAGVLTRAELGKLAKALLMLEQQIERHPQLLATSTAEDVHEFIERELVARVGDLGKKLHTGRSRNDQVATDLKLWLRYAARGLDTTLLALQKALVDIAARFADLPLPGYTHLQRAQPITAGHHCLAYVEMLARDRSRIADALVRMGTSPLGSGALAGTAYPVDRDQLARELGFAAGPTRNSLDAVSDRDHAAEIGFACALAMTHMSRLCEDWIFFASTEAGFLHLDDAVATGSSLMPQKKNPDALELVRGKTGRVLGHLQGLLVTLKGLPLAYDKDLQEDKEALFDALDTTTACARVLAIVIRHARFDAERCRSEAGRGYLNATDLADLLVRQGVPFRTAHARVGAAVRKAQTLHCELEHLPEIERRRLLPELEGDLRRLLAVDAVLGRRDVTGGTAPRRVRAEIKAWQKKLS